MYDPICSVSLSAKPGLVVIFYHDIFQKLVNNERGFHTLPRPLMKIYIADYSSLQRSILINSSVFSFCPARAAELRNYLELTSGHLT